MNEQFIQKVYRSVLYMWALAIMWTLFLGKPWIAVSITLGTALGTAILVTFDLAIRKFFVPRVKKPSRSLLVLALIKYPLIGVFLYFLVRWEKINLLAFCGGIILVHAAIFAKLAGIKIAERTRKP